MLRLRPYALVGSTLVPIGTVTHPPRPVPEAPDRGSARVSLADLADSLAGARLCGDAASARATVLGDVTLDSTEAAPGVLFACRPGTRTDGHLFAPQAAASGSPALLVERVLDLPVPQVRVPSVAEAVGPAAALVHGHPSRRLLLAGVTGTNGKTTSVYLLEAAMRGAGHVTGLIGTVQTVVAGVARTGVRTTPEATDLQRLFADMLEQGVSAAAMEVSSHGLALGRVRGTRFAVVLFTNLTQDHLDFHGDIEEYFSAKASLFDPAYSPSAVINLDDPYGARLADIATERGLDTVGVSLGGVPAAAARAQDVVLETDSSRFTAVLDGRRVPVRLRLPGRFNVANALGALAAVARLGADPEEAAAGMAALRGVPGRMERVDAGQPFAVVVDYAHTPDSLEHVLRAAREFTRGRTLVVVGCGGDRDRGKREPMGAAAASLADFAVFTSDNPRSEDPAVILDALVAGARTAGGSWTVEPSRYEAIRLALESAEPGDVVVLAGKGHETTQEFASITVPFDDRAVARELLEPKWSGGGE
jgi:UDP-N-acetylmuramoyl-L-alanyl-D-glutamate--2,6-diaminopimelate ligase